MFIIRKTLLKPLHNKSPNPPPFLYGVTCRFFSDNKSNLHHHQEQPDDPDKPTSAYYDQLVTVAGCSRDFTSLHRILNKRFKDGCFNTINTFRFITEEEDPNSIILDQLTQTLARLDRGFVRKGAFDSLIARLCKSNLIHEAQRVISKMLEEKEDNNGGVNASTFHPLINALTRQRKTDEAWGVLGLMREKGIAVDITAYNYILTMYCYDGDVTAATQVLEKIREEGLKEDSRTYDAMVLGACKSGEVEGALAIMRKMVEARVPAMYSTHAHVINAMLGLGYYAQAVEFVLAFGGREKGLDTESFGHLGSCLVRRKRVKEAKIVFGEMDKRGLKVGEKLRSEYLKMLSALDS